MTSPLRVLSLTLLSAVLLPPIARSQITNPSDDEALTAVTHALCHREVVMLGESATHGDGHTEAFKVALIQRLINHCGFDSVFFESSHYEFLHIARQLRSGQPISADQVSTAVGGLWKFDQEFQPLLPFLVAKLQSGQITVGGLDDQLGQLGQDYANVQMVTALAALLPQPQATACGSALQSRVNNDYPEASPYSKADQSEINNCLVEIRTAIAADTTADRATSEDREEMVSAFQRWIARDFASSPDYIVARDRSMFQSFEWLRTQQPRRRKVIVWAATVHIAKQADPTWGDHTGTNFGSFVHQKYGARAFSLGFSALSGSFRKGRRDIQQIPAAPPDSLEAQTLHGTSADAVFVPSSQLETMATLPGAVFRHAYQTLHWATFLDGVVAFRQERPPTSTR